MKYFAFILFIFLIVSVSISGCLSTQEAEPALVNQPTIDRMGWVQSDDVKKAHMNQEIGGVEIGINTAMVSYFDKALMMDMNQQVNDKMATKGGSKEIQELQFTSTFTTIRLAFPAGITIPTSLLMEIIELQIENIAQDNNLLNFEEVGTQTVTLSTGSTVKALSYEGYIENNDAITGNGNVRGIIATWNDDGMTNIVIGIVPAQDLILNVSTQITPTGSLTIEINEEQEYQDILTLIQNIE